MVIFNRAFLGNPGIETILPNIDALKARWQSLVQRGTKMKEWAENILTQEQATTETFIGNAANAINTIKAKLEELNNKVTIKTSELNITPPQIMQQVKHKKCCFLCIGNCPVYTMEPLTNPRVAEIHKEIEAIQTEKAKYTGLLSTGMTIFNGLHDYWDKIKGELVDRTSLKSKIAEFFAPTEEGVPSVITKMLPMLCLGGFLAVSMVRKPEKEKK